MFRLVTTPDGNNPDAHDLELDVGGRFVFVDGVTGEISTEDLAQSIRTRLLHFKGENYLDSRTGVPWFQSILIKAPNLVRTRAAIRNTIASVPGIASVPVVDLSLDRVTRHLTIAFEAVTTTGATIRSIDFAPLILEF